MVRVLSDQLAIHNYRDKIILFFDFIEIYMMWDKTILTIFTHTK